MKTKFKFLMSAVVLGSSSFAFAHGSIIEKTSDAIAAASDKYENEEQDAVNRYVGIAGAPGSNDKINVVVTTKQNGEIKYSCYEHEMNGRETWMCDKK